MLFYLYYITILKCLNYIKIHDFVFLYLLITAYIEFMKKIVIIIFVVIIRLFYKFK